MHPLKFSLTIVASLLFVLSTPHVCLAQTLVDLFRDIKTEHPPCDSPLDLSVSEDHFVPIANDLPGVSEYNHLTSLLQEKQWATLDQSIEPFFRAYESSPLREAVSYLHVYSLFDRVTQVDSPEYREAEKTFSEAKLLYPKSDLIPVILAVTAARHLREGLYAKSLAQYRAAREEYPFSDLACVFQAGIAESNLLLGDRASSRSSYQQLLQKCQNPRLRLGAEMRLAELSEREKGSDSSIVLEKIFARSPQLVERYYPPLLYSLGEKKFARGQLASSQFFLEAYLKSRQPVNCKAYAAKRLADIHLRQSQDLKSIIGQYLEVKEKFAGTDPGRFSQLQGLLLGLNKVDGAEVQRRLRVIDDEVDRIELRSLRETGYLEKALTLLDHGETEAVGSLLKVKENGHLRVDQGTVGKFVRARLLDLLAKAPEVKPADLRKQAASELDLYHSMMETWLGKSPDAARANQLVEKRIGTLAQAAFAADQPEVALEILERAQKLALLPPVSGKGGHPAFRQALAQVFMGRLIESPARKELAGWFLQQRDRALPYFEPAANLIWLSAAVENGDDETIVSTLKTVSQDRRPAATPDLPPRLRDYYRYNEGKALTLLKRWGAADSRLAPISGELQGRALELRLQIALEEKRYAKAFDLGVALLEKKGSDDRGALFDTLRQTCYDGKLWTKVPGLITKLKAVKMPEDRWPTFHYLAGKAAWETKHCPVAVEHYENALMKAPGAGESSEARFRLGKCYMQLHKPSQAKKVWQELLSSQDAFWSKLARNELNLSNN